MNRVVLALLWYAALASGCQGPDSPAPGACFGPGSQWRVSRFRSSTLPGTFAIVEYPLLEALLDEQVAWSVVGPGRLVMRNSRGQRTAAAVVERGDTLTLVFPGHAPLRAAIRLRGTDTVALHTLALPQIDLYLTRVASLRTP